MDAARDIILLLLGVAQFLIIAHVVVSLLINFNVLNARQPLVRAIWQGLERLFEPIYGPLRRMLPDTRPLDLTPLAALICIYILEIIVIRSM
ncbi:MAG: YggT family protein [Pseudomonadota bacterium]